MFELMVALQVGAAIAGTGAVGVLAHQRGRALCKVQDSDALFDVAAAMASSLNVKEVFEIVLEQARNVTAAECGALLRISRGGVMVAAGAVPVAHSAPDLVVPINSSEAGGFVLHLWRAKGFGERERARAQKLGAIAGSAIANAFQYGARAEEATRDGLTGACTRREFERRLRDELSRHARGGGPVSVMLVDVDHFKSVNDTFGHGRGDEVLARVAELATQTVRTHDVVGRLGGDEFAVILVDTSVAGARRAAHRLVRAVRGAALEAGSGKRVSVSVGVATCPADGFDSAALLASADAALCRAKRAGRNGVAASSAATRQPRRQLPPVLEVVAS